MDKCNHIGVTHELCHECGGVKSCGGCGEKIRFDFWDSAYQDKIEFLIKREAEFEQRERLIEEKELKIKEFITGLK